jgi:DoxX-like family
MARPLAQRRPGEFLNFASERTIEVKAKTLLYWTTTCLIALETFAGGVMDLTHGRTGVVSGPFVTQVVTSLGYPTYILAIIGIYKIPGAVTLVVPGFLRLKEWAYAGIIFELSGAAASHAACGNWDELIPPLSLLCLAIASWSLRPPGRMIGARLHADGHAASSLGA